MPYRHLTLFSAAILLLMLGASVAAGLHLPADTMLPVHWDITGTPDRFAEKWNALLTLPAVTLFVAGLFAVLPAIEPMQDGLRRSAGLYTLTWGATVVVMAVAHGMTMAVALGWPVPVSAIMMLLVGGLLIVVGNQLAKSRRMFFIGIRTPWTLADEDVWIATHRLGGRLMMACGLAFWIVAIGQPDPATAAPFVIAALGATVIVPVAYSYILWRRKFRQAG